MIYLFKLIKLLRSIYSFPGLNKVIDTMVLEFLKGRALATSNKVDDKLVLVVGAALKNKNYRAVMNGKAKA